MSMNVYLKREQVEASDTLTKKQKGEFGQSYFEFRLDDQLIIKNVGVWYINWNESTPIPDWLEPLVQEVSLFEAFPMAGRRETGIYRYETAKAELDTRPGNKGREEYRVEIRGEKASDVLELRRLIRVGTIRPEQSFEGPQGGLSRRELEVKVTQLEGEKVELQGRVSELEAELEKPLVKKTILQKLAGSLSFR